MATSESGEFETALRRLDEIVQRLERDGGVGLEESVKLFGEGKALAEKCEALLRDAQRAIESDAAGGAPGASNAEVAAPPATALPPRSARQPGLYEPSDVADADPDL